MTAGPASAMGLAVSDAIYMLFAGHTYYPDGGTEDLRATFRADTDEAAIAHAKPIAFTPREADWYYVIALDPDALAWRIVWDPHAWCEATANARDKGTTP